MSDKRRAEWMAQGSYGLMVHYLITPAGDTSEKRTEAFCRTVDGFELQTFLDAFASTGADWLIFTIGQNTGYYCSPNAFLDGALPGRTSSRDLVREVAEGVHALGKRFIAYLPAEVEWQSSEVKRAYGADRGDWGVFLKGYGRFVRAYGERLAKLIDGWWFDGCYDEIHAGKTDWNEFCANARAGNPDAAIALNDGGFCVGRTRPVSAADEDYLAGEVHALEDAEIVLGFLGEGARRGPDGRWRNADGERMPHYMPDGQYVDGVQWQALVPVDSTFNPAIPTQSYADEELASFIVGCKSVGGAVTLNLPISDNGIVPADSIAQMRRLMLAIR